MSKKNSVTIKGVDTLSANFKKFLRAMEKDKDIMTDVALLTREQIVKRTRARLEEYKQPELSPATVKRRKRLIEVGNGSLFSKPSRSNLTLSSQLLDAIIFRLNVTSGAITFFLKDFRVPYIGVRGEPLENKTNTEIQAELEKNGRKFLFISKNLEARLQTRIIQSFRRKLSNYKKLIKTFK
jgi:hypothetical protein